RLSAPSERGRDTGPPGERGRGYRGAPRLRRDVPSHPGGLGAVSWPPCSTKLGWQGHERIAPERVVDDALHLGDLCVGPRLEAKREIGIRVRGAHETPAAAWKKHARPVDVDRLVAPLEVARDLLDDAELLGVGA